MQAADVSLTRKLGTTDSIVVATANVYKAEIVTSDEHLRVIKNVKFTSQ
jgi:predicted nucleic acid-binding protein